MYRQCQFEDGMAWIVVLSHPHVEGDTVRIDKRDGTKTGNWVKTCSILTTTPNAVTSVVHDRMPVILDPDSYDLWLDPGMQNVAAISELLKPFDARLMRCYPVSARVNHVANDDEGCSVPVELAQTQNSLCLCRNAVVKI
jgi:putative SOS response-associated peptidase YedK